MRRSEATWAKWKALIEEQAASGLPATRFCRERGIPISTMFVWKRKLRDAGGAAGGASAGASAPAFLEAIVRRGVPARAEADGGVTIELSCGRRVRVSPGFDRGVLLEVLGVLESHGRREMGA